MFREALIEFAVPMAVETKGKSGLRIMEGTGVGRLSTNSVPYKYLFLEEDMSYLPPEIRDQIKNPDGHVVSDVESLTYEDLENHGVGKAQYKGKLRDPAQLAGKHHAASYKELKALQESITPENYQEIEEELEELFKEELGIPKENFVGEPILNEKLELNVHLGQLQLHQNIPGQAKTRLEALKDLQLIARLDGDQAKRFKAVLKKIIALEKRREDILNFPLGKLPVVEQTPRTVVLNAQLAQLFVSELEDQLSEPLERKVTELLEVPTDVALNAFKSSKSKLRAKRDELQVQGESLQAAIKLATISDPKKAKALKAELIECTRQLLDCERQLQFSFVEYELNKLSFNENKELFEKLPDIVGYVENETIRNKLLGFIATTEQLLHFEIIHDIESHSARADFKFARLFTKEDVQEQESFFTSIRRQFLDDSVSAEDKSSLLDFCIKQSYD